VTVVPSNDHSASMNFLQTAYQPDDWVAMFLKTYRTGEVAQRVVPVCAALRPEFQAWLRHQNSRGWNVYVSVNAVSPGRSRTRESIAAVRHLFLDVDVDGPGLLANLTMRPDLPPPSYVLHSSPGRLHVFWRTRGFDTTEIELLQKRLARELETDPAATSCAQTTRLPGFVNHKHTRPFGVFVEYIRPNEILPRADFPRIERTTRVADVTHRAGNCQPGGNPVRRAREFLRSIAPAVAGQRGDSHTFRVCCRVVRGFDLPDDEAMSALAEWNARCVPPWSEHDLRTKIRNARLYGRERIGGLLG
jgi:hypothetical protein